MNYENRNVELLLTILYQLTIDKYSIQMERYIYIPVATKILIMLSKEYIARSSFLLSLNNNNNS